jgi:hypothetical protein
LHVDMVTTRSTRRARAYLLWLPLGHRVLYIYLSSPLPRSVALLPRPSPFINIPLLFINVYPFHHLSLFFTILPLFSQKRRFLWVLSSGRRALELLGLSLAVVGCRDSYDKCIPYVSSF